MFGWDWGSLLPGHMLAAVPWGCEGACALGRTRVGTIIKPQEKGADAGLGLESSLCPGTPLLACHLQNQSQPDRRAILVLYCPGGCLVFSQTLPGTFGPCKDTSALLMRRICLQDHRVLSAQCLMPAALLPAMHRGCSIRYFHLPKGDRQRTSRTHESCQDPGKEKL